MVSSRPTTVQRGYGYKHRKLRQQWRPQVEAGLVACASCHEPIQPDDRWDLGHTEDRTDWTGPEHAWCNRSTTVAGKPYLISSRQRPRPRQRNCENCGCEYRAGYREQKYCGRSCAAQAMKQRLAERPKSQLVEKACLECGQTFAARNDLHRVCSDQCGKRRAHQRKLNRYHSDPEWRALVIERAKASYRRRSGA